MEMENKTYKEKKIRIKNDPGNTGARDGRQQHKSVMIAITHTVIKLTV